VFSQKAPVKRKYLSGGLSNFIIDYFYVQKEYRCLQQREEETNERAVRARVRVSLCLSLSVPLRAQYVQKPKNNFAKMNEEKKKIIIKRSRRAEEEKEKKTKKKSFILLP